MRGIRKAAIALPMLLSLAPPPAFPAAVDGFPWRRVPPVELQCGDLVCRRGNGLWSRRFAEFSTREPRFSHVGVVWKSGGEPTLVHADASDWSGRGCVRETSWRDFFEHAAATECAVFRFDGPSRLAIRFADCAHARLGVPFDAGFDLSDTNRLYCTELLAVSLAEATGRDSVPRTWYKGKAFIAIDDLYFRGFLRIYDSEDLPPAPAAQNTVPCKGDGG